MARKFTITDHKGREWDFIVADRDDIDAIRYYLRGLVDKGYIAKFTFKDADNYAEGLSGLSQLLIRHGLA